MDSANKASVFFEAFDDVPLCTIPDPIALLEEEHELQRELCNVLEALADDLPTGFDKGLATVAVAILEGSMERHMRLEEEGLFPLLRECVADTDPIHSAMRCLEEEHGRDSGSLVEITDVLKAAIQKNAVENAEMLGYMLRGFFECLRRHVAWEDRVLIPTARSVLSSHELSKLQAWVMDSEHPRCCHQSLVLIQRAQSAREICNKCPNSISHSNVVPLNIKKNPSL